MLATLTGIIIILSVLMKNYALAEAIYQLDTAFSGSTFFDDFDFFTGHDPTNGFVDYQSRSDATSRGLIQATDGAPALMSVDDSNVYDSNINTYDASYASGRPSVRITSKKSWTHALIIADIAHMPGGICGTWPAFWTVGGNWPNNGEIDIVEGVNSASDNLMSLHTSSNCSNDDSQSYGQQFNDQKGGVFAMEWTSDYIRVWSFAAGGVPPDITAGTSPDPTGWGIPKANFQGACSIDDHFRNHKIVFDTTFCGDWSGDASVWSSDSQCGTAASSCNEYVANNPTAFTNA
ncbi:MAG: hypothetical protein Q9227_005612 [Pyrenula ochraceoflavens]